ncbi:cupin domain-containing protein [Flammeovirga agarivorans]|uniref:Cupin domain-containing protein n=1 Tax=Flammeovirga agarivorans TaxID=2726742 RepID=A0A7X8SL88_9BACT|nr:cupin domain-containing protein [Flammeovirga agarivorans]NLR92198.1 cupin domain-containing protein [Flammeovirga agarivorans]
MTKDELINHLNMMPHPEGGYYVETYRSHKIGMINKNNIERNASTAIYFLMGDNDFSTFHKLKFTEIWHHYDGNPVEIVEITPKGELKRSIVGKDFLKGETPQHVITGGNWFAARTIESEGSDYVLVGCTVAPGFEFEDFEIADVNKLAVDYPDHKEIIMEFKK